MGSNVLTMSKRTAILVSVLATLIVLDLQGSPLMVSAYLRDIRSGPMGPPKRPQNFKSVDQLNSYLAELADYYSVLGRPRFGKRNYDNELPVIPGYRIFKKRSAEQQNIDNNDKLKGR